MRIHRTQPYQTISPRRALHSAEALKANGHHAHREVRVARTEPNSTTTYWRWKCYWNKGIPGFASACLSTDPAYTCPDRIMTDKTRFPLYCDTRLELMFPTTSPLGFQAWCNDLFYRGIVTEDNPVYSSRCAHVSPSTCEPTPDCPGDVSSTFPPRLTTATATAASVASTGLLVNLTALPTIGTGAGASAVTPVVTGLAVGLGVLGASVVVGGALYAGYRWGKHHQQSTQDTMVSE